jgi:hypothetical protein
VPPFILGAAGFFLGIYLVPQLLRWALLVHTTIRPLGGEFLGAPKRRLLWATPFVVLLHPLPYFVAASVVVVTLALRGRASAGWLWFLTGIYGYALLMGILLVPRLLKVRRKPRTGQHT